jgi:ATP-dependent RNA helicase DDX19/DBP5
MIHSRVPKTVQTLLFSATFPAHVRNFANKFAPRANEIMLKTEELSVEGIKQFYLDCTSEAQKFEVLVQLYSLLTVGQSIIFVQVCCSKPYPSLSLLTISHRKG